MATPPGDDRLFVLEVRKGTIRVVDDGEVLDDPFIDISERLAENGQGEERGRQERGLLSMVFHPDYAENGRFFLWYADESGIGELAEYQVSDDPNRADAASLVVLREFEVARDHFGGELLFGPDGYLWLSIGDGGRRKNAQKLDIPRGAILRFDVSTPGVAEPAPDNPFIGVEDAAKDMWAIGLRNPWRISIDEPTGLLYVGDVGLDTIEEVNVQPYDEPGIDYGWPTAEGSACFTLDEPVECDTTGMVPPVIEMPHDDVCSVIGGSVYRGAAIPEIVGMYFYSDFCGGFLRSFVFADGAVTDELQWFDSMGPVSSFAVDNDGELYITSTDGRLRKLVAAG